MEQEPNEEEIEAKKEEYLAMITGLDHEIEHLQKGEAEGNAESIIRKTELRNDIAGKLGELTGMGKEEIQELITKYKEKKG